MTDAEKLQDSLEYDLRMFNLGDAIQVFEDNYIYVEIEIGNWTYKVRFPYIKALYSDYNILRADLLTHILFNIDREVYSERRPNETEV